MNMVGETALRDSTLSGILFTLSLNLALIQIGVSNAWNLFK